MTKLLINKSIGKGDHPSAGQCDEHDDNRWQMEVLDQQASTAHANA